MRTLANRIRQRLSARRKSRRQVIVTSSFKDSGTGLFVHGLHKSASMFLFKFFDDLCDQIDVPIFSIHNEHPKSPPTDTAVSFVHCPVRSFKIESGRFANLKSVKHLMHVRDPRDILVSEYYSLGWRHKDDNWDQDSRERRQRIQELTIDQYVIEEPEIAKYPLAGRYRELLGQVGRPDVQVVKYETMVSDFRSWLNEVLPLIGIQDEVCLDAVNKKYEHEFQPDPTPNSHKRNVTPGDHLRKLAPATIGILNDRFAEVLASLEY